MTYQIFPGDTNFIQFGLIFLGLAVNFALDVLPLSEKKYYFYKYILLWILIALSIGGAFISAIVVGFGLGIPFISNPFGGVIHLDQLRLNFFLFQHHSVLIVADILAILWLTWIMNMVNWSKGVDGQLPGFVAIPRFSLLFCHSDLLYTISLFNR